MATKRTKTAVTVVSQDPPTLWQRIKDFFYRSETIALAWLTTAFGTITGLIGAMDWSPLWTFLRTGTDFTSKQLLWIGVSVAGLGISAYVARIHGTKVVDGKLLPKAN